ncbi:hypothetical protein GCM10022247_72060 [Allokutzneria multivorans]|uniref:Uncharacterized protein n=1 Tax=Allokutzneria multivorans TaxID=1142134 RepID=A0ABP7U4M7_9PSEU
MDISPADPFDIDVRVVTPTEDAPVSAFSTMFTWAPCPLLSKVVCPNGNG